jgi:hypothetical protein
MIMLQFSFVQNNESSFEGNFLSILTFTVYWFLTEGGEGGCFTVPFPNPKMLKMVKKP